MEVIVLPSAADVARVAADLIAGVFRQAPSGVFGLATGSSPLAIYSELARMVDQQDLDLTRVTGFALDEYVGIPLDHPESYASVLQRVVTEPLRMDRTRVRVPDGRADDLADACESFEQAIRQAGGVDLQLLGIGRNGHIGFNEPTSAFASRTRVKTLAPQTLADNARFFASAANVPIHCITQGLGTILDARQLLLVADGVTKADAIAAAVEGPVSSMCPASALQMHRHAVVIVDEAAASGLTLRDYYAYVYDNKPR